MDYYKKAYNTVIKSLLLGDDEEQFRKLCQAKIYLLQLLDTEFGYNYILYREGPKSLGLTEYLDENIKIIIYGDYDKAILNKSVQEHIDIINRLSSYRRPMIQHIEWYQLMASVAYITKNIHMWIDKSKHNIGMIEASTQEILKKHTKWDSKTDYMYAKHILEQCKILREA